MVRSIGGCDQYSGYYAQACYHCRADFCAKIRLVPHSHLVRFKTPTTRFLPALITALQLDSPEHLDSPNQDDNVRVQSKTSMISNVESQHSISVDIYTKSTGRDIINTKRNIFPEDRDVESLGDVTEALRRVQQMQTIFRRNTKRLQQKIGIPEAGCV